MYKDFSEGVVVLTMPSFYHKRLKSVILVTGMLFLAVLGAEHTKKSLPEKSGSRMEVMDEKTARATTVTNLPLIRAESNPLSVIDGKFTTELKTNVSDVEGKSGVTGEDNRLKEGMSERKIIVAMPDIPMIPDVPITPGVPTTPDMPKVPDLPIAPDISDIPNTPDRPKAPDYPETPSVPTEPTDSEKTGSEESPGLLVEAGFLLDEEGWIVGIDEATFQTEDGYLELPSESCVGIRAYVFDGCGEEITEIYVPDNITGIEEGAFSGLPDLEWLDVAVENPNFVSMDGVIFDRSGSKLYAFPGARTGTYEPPATLTEIADYAMDETCLSALEFRKYQDVKLGRFVFGTENGMGIQVYINGEYLKEFEATFDGYDVEIVPYYP